MSRWIETIAVKNGLLMHLSDHQERMDRTIRDMLGIDNSIILETSLTPPAELDGLFKCRIVYDTVIHMINWESYSIRELGSIALVHINDLEYSTKKEDRSTLEELVKKSQADDVIIVQHGKVTDASYANLIFRKDQNWITPSTPLLEGTMRNRLLRMGKIEECPVHVEDLMDFDGFKYINAMLDMENSPELPIQIIRGEKKAGC